MSYGFEYGADTGFGGGFNGADGYGAGGFGFGDMGGGFMGGGGEEQKKSGDKKTRDRQNFMSVTLKQLNSSRTGDDAYRVDDVDVHTVQLVGTVAQFQDETTNYSFKLSDGTGEIDCKKWKDNDSVSIFNALREGQTARVVGTIREFAGRSHLLVYNVTPIVNWNEVTHHILDVIFTHLQNTKGRIPLPHGSAPMAPSAQSFGTPARGAFGGNLNNAVKTENNKLDEQVFNAYRSGASRQEGLHFTEVMRALRANGVNISQEKLISVVEQLCNDGRLYTTIDEEHYRPTVDDY